MENKARSSNKAAKGKIDNTTVRNVKENIKDMKAGAKRFDKDTSARAENYNKEEKRKPGALHYELGKPRGKR